MKSSKRLGFTPSDFTTSDFTPSASPLKVETFPYKHLTIKPEDLKKRFRNLVNYKPKFATTNYNVKNTNLSFIERCYLPSQKPVILELGKNDYLDYNLIADFFTEEQRMNARRNGKESTMEFWKKNKGEIVAECQKKYGNMKTENLREMIYAMSYEVTSFRPTNMVAMIKKFKATSVLDFCSGWGDRLIGAMACGVNYTGIDPNTALHPKYEEMIEFFHPKKKINMICEPFEDVDLGDQMFDLIFTSPPYFDLEHYTNEETQSTIRYESDRWYKDFLLTVLKKSWVNLTIGGHMVIILNDSPDCSQPIVKRMINDVNMFTDSLYLGVISYAERIKQGWRSPQPMWIWKKTKGLDIKKFNIDKLSVDSFVVRDDLLFGGTKSRGIKFLKKVREDEIVYAGPNNGFAQCALAVAGKKYGKKATMFLSENSIITFRARMLGLNVVKVGKKNLKEIQQIARCYSRENQAYLVPFGFGNENFKKELYINIFKNFPPALKVNNVWLAAGSGVILEVLYKIFPKAHFYVVQVGKEIHPEKLDEFRTTIFIAPQKFWENATVLPPYDSIPSYDGKIWQFFKAREEKDGINLIWNVGSEILL